MVNLDIVEMIKNLNELGVREVFLPFVLIFTVLFTLLDKTHIFIRISKSDGDEDKQRKKADNRKFSAIVSLAISLTAVFMHVRGTTIAGVDMINFINSAVPGITGLIVVIFGLFIVLALVMPSIFPQTGRLDMPISVILIVAAIAIYIYAVSIHGPFSSSISVPFVGTWLENETFRSLAISLLVFGGIVFYIIRGKKEEDPTKTSVWSTIGDALKKRP